MMFYQKGIHIGRGHEKGMFDFIKNHFRYYTLSGWNKLKSIANKVKVYDLNLPYNTNDILEVLEITDGQAFNDIIERWEAEHKGYSVGFNGRSGGYLVLCNKNSYQDISGPVTTHFDTYEDFKEAYLQVDRNRLLRDIVKVVRDFDRLCDELRVVTAYLTDLYVKGEITQEDAGAEFAIEYEYIPKDFRKRIENS